MDTPARIADRDRAIVKAIRRLVPFLLLMYVLAFLDRVNIGFARQAFQYDTGLSNRAYAFGAGIFFFGYALLEVPSNLILHRVGARLWMCRIMVTWGLVSAASMWAHSATTFYVLRFLLGIAEAGFFPGIIYFLTLWFPAHARTRVFGLFYLGAPLAFIFGSPLSGALLELNGVFGLRGWQWLFLIEGLLATLVGIAAGWYLDDRPTEARWLSDGEREALAAALAAEEQFKYPRGPHGVLAALTNGRVLFLALIYFLIQMSVYGVVFYLPTQVAMLLGTTVGWKVGFAASVPWIGALAAAYWVPRHAERTGRHAATASGVMLVSAAGVALSVMITSPLPGLIALSFAAAGFIAVQPLFWSFPAAQLSGTAAASGVALINSFGALGGFVAPNIRQAIEQALASSRAGLLLLAATTFLGALLFQRLRTPPITPQLLGTE
jgi:MFS family permease